MPSTMAARRFVSRGAEKLAGALDALELDVRGVRALDAGASTGGFTQVLLERGAHEVIAVDVGYGQLAWELRTDERVRVLERTNVRTLDRAAVGQPVDFVVADLSFISLRTVAPALLSIAAPDARLLLMVKPQFELPRQRVPRGGVVREPADRHEAMVGVATAYRALGCALRGAAPSPLPGPKGNREFFLLFERDGGDVGDGVLNQALERGP